MRLTEHCFLLDSKKPNKKEPFGSFLLAAVAC